MSGLEEGKTTAAEDLSQPIDRCSCIKWQGPWTHTAFYLCTPCLLVLMRHKETSQFTFNYDSVFLSIAIPRRKYSAVTIQSINCEITYGTRRTKHLPKL